MKKLKVAFVRDVMNQWYREEITFSRIVEMLNEEVKVDLHKVYEDKYYSNGGDVDVVEWNTISRLEIALNKTKIKTMIYLLENSEGQWFKNFSYDKTKVNAIAETELTDDVTKAWQFSHKKDAEDYINQQTHRVFTSQEFVVTEHEIVDNDLKAKEIKTLTEALQGSHDLIALCLDDHEIEQELWDKVQSDNKQALKK